MKSHRFTEGTRALALLVLVVAAACGGRVVDTAEGAGANGSGANPIAGLGPGPVAVDGQSSGDTDAGPLPMSIPASVCTPLVNDETCSVSFNRDILQKMFGATGTLHCAKAGCHDATGGFDPLIDPTKAAMTYDDLYNAISTISYINPCSTDPNASAILRSLAFPSTVGTHMPMDDTTGALPSAADLATITTWVECGAPFN